jgi:2-oxo-4-hydroxy-4-carboxy--5-ureidoimidazoline (OHCU) decarboxylase
MATSGGQPSITGLDRMDPVEFCTAVGPLFEDAPAYLALLAAERPFGSWDALFERAQTVALEAPRGVQLELLAAHPRIGAPPGTVSSLSWREQGYDREQQEAIAALGPLNDAYEVRFGFRYVIFVNGRPRSAIVPLLQAALEEDPDAERTRGLRDVVAIAQTRAIALGMHAPGDVSITPGAREEVAR